VNVGLVVPGFSADGTDWCIPALRHFARALAAEDQVRVIALRYPYRADRYTVDSADVIAIGGANQRGLDGLAVWQRTLRTIGAEHRRRRFDVLHAFWATESGLLAALAGRLLRVPTLVSLAGGELVALPDIGYGDQRRAWERAKISAALRLSSAVSAGSEYLVRIAERRTGRRLELLPLGVDTHMFKPVARAPGSQRLLHVGTLTPVKDQRTLLLALAELRRRLPGVTLDMVGDGPLGPELQALAARLDLQTAVHFSGERGHSRLPEVYRAADVFVISSRHEAQGMVALEAASCAIPIVGTCVGNVPDLAPSSSVPVAQPAALADALEAQWSQAAQESGCEVRRVVESRFSVDVSVQGYRQCYARLAA
jgi:glycosyltransferase involved in cell wall biosynthesis